MVKLSSKSIALALSSVLIFGFGTAQAQQTIKEKVLNRTVHTYTVNVNDRNYVSVISTYQPATAFDSNISANCSFWKDKPSGTKVKLTEILFSDQNGIKNQRLQGVNKEDICGRFYFARTQPNSGG